MTICLDTIFMGRRAWDKEAANMVTFQTKRRARIAIISIRHLNIFNVLRLIWSTVTSGINVTSACPVLLNLFHCSTGWSFSQLLTSDLFCGSRTRVGIIRVHFMRLLISVYVFSNSSVIKYWPHRWNNKTNWNWYIISHLYLFIPNSLKSIEWERL